MYRFYWNLRIWSKRLSIRLKNKLRLLRIVFASLFYNSFMDIYYIGDTALEPLFWFVDHFTRFFGPVFVFGVCALTASVVVIAYMVGIPYWWNRSVGSLIFLMIMGHWLLINIIFHYYMAAVTSPGHPPEGILIPEAVSICKKCIAPKPPRTHHCSICNRCVLKMDHHCPWLNNCIGHYNHRYFFLYCMYMIAGAIFIICFGRDIFMDHFWNYKSGYHNGTEININETCENPVCKQEHNNIKTILRKLDIIKHKKSFPWEDEPWYHGVMMYTGLLCLGVMLALGSLTAWHARLIGKGETSIEAHINNAERAKYKKEGKVYFNPYDFGTRNNWKLFLGMQHGRSWRHILLPSTHPPQGSGLQWQTAHQEKMNMCI